MTTPRTKFALAAMLAIAATTACTRGEAEPPPEFSQVTLPFDLDNTASAVLVRPDGTFVVTDIGPDAYFDSVNSDLPGRILELSPDASEAEVTVADTPAPVVAALSGDDLYVGELTSVSNDDTTSFDDAYVFQVRVFGDGAPRVVPFDLLSLDDFHGYEAVPAMAVSADGDIAVCAQSTFDGDVVRLPNGEDAPVVIAEDTSCDQGLAFNSAGDLYSLGEDVMVKYPQGSDEAEAVWLPSVARPSGFTIGSDDSIYVVDNGTGSTGQRVVVFTDGSEDVRTIPFRATVNGHHGIAVAGADDVVLTDDNLVYRLSATPAE